VVPWAEMVKGIAVVLAVLNTTVAVTVGPAEVLRVREFGVATRIPCAKAGAHQPKRRPMTTTDGTRWRACMFSLLQAGNRPD